jgi:diketogulonate reductase-like aldo/keto reductase
MPQLGLGVFRNTGGSVVSACLAAFEAGYRHIDSAQAYSNEKEVTEAVLKSGLKREEVFISAFYQFFLPSLSIFHDPTNVFWLLLPLATKILSGNYSLVPTSVTRSLQQFATHDNDEFKFGYIDLLLIHDPNCGPNGRLTMWKDFLKARDDGLVRSVGVSNLCVQFFSPQTQRWRPIWFSISNARHLQEIADAGLELPAVNQVELHPFCQQKEIVKWCTDHGVVVQVSSPIIVLL